jgi:hypothetical protein
MDIPQLANPLILLLISPVVLAGWYAIRKGIPRALIVSRIIILSLLIIALASPFTLGTSTVRDEAPRITVISDQTMSMDLFNKDTGTKIFESIKSKTPTTYRQFAGISSPIGDEVINNAENNNLVLVSDGNNNHGKDLFDAISFVSRTGTKVFAVKQKPIHNDASVEIESAKNLIIGNENVFNIVVRQAGNETSYRLDVQIDGASVKLPDESKNVVQTERVKVIPVSATFNSLGTHKVTATITPSGEDWFKLNNVFYNSVFVVPKPKVLAVTDDTTSPLYKVATSLYEVKTLNTVPDDLAAYKAVIIDNKGAAQLSAESLRKYAGSGGGLVVVGGDAAYDKGSYNNSPVEALLPIISRAAEYKGGRNVVIVIDASGSTAGDFISLIDANAISLVRNLGRDSHVAVVAIGGQTAQTALLPLSSSANIVELESFIREIGPKGGGNPTNINDGFGIAEELLGSASGIREIILLSDGNIPTTTEGVDTEAIDATKEKTIDLTDKEFKIHFVQLLTSSQKFKVANRWYKEIALHSSETNYLFSWDEVPGNDNKNIIEFLAYKFGIDWVNKATIEKINKNQIKVYYEKDEISLILNDDRTKVDLIIGDKKIDEFGVKIENNRLNIYDAVLVLNPDERASAMFKAAPDAAPTPTPEAINEYPLAAVDSNHFITKYLNLTASVTGYNEVTPKLGGERLVATTRGKPILTTWGFGLGRVASFTTDNGNPGSNTAWASAVYSGENSRLVSSMINWAIGDPRPREGVVIQAEDIWAGTPGKIVITSNTRPIVKLDGKNEINLIPTGPTTFEYSINFDKDEDIGFHDLSGTGEAKYGIAVNYPLEYREVGFNEKLNTVIESNGGRVYDESEVEGLLLLDIKEKAVRTVQEPKSQKEPFLLAALGLFLAEVIIRRLKDYRKERPDIQDNPPRVAPEEPEVEK